MIAGRGQYLIVWDERINRPRELNCFETPEYGDYPITVMDKDKFWALEVDYERKHGKRLMSLPKKELFAFFNRTCPEETSMLEKIIHHLEHLKSDLEVMDEYGTYDYRLERLAREVSYIIEDLTGLKDE